VIEEQLGTKTDPTEKATGALSEPEHCDWVLLSADDKESRSDRYHCPLSLRDQEDIYPNNVGVYLKRTEFFIQTERDYCCEWVSDPCSSSEVTGSHALSQGFGVIPSWNVTVGEVVRPPGD
jgi:hypothetical protein